MKNLGEYFGAWALRGLVCAFFWATAALPPAYAYEPTLSAPGLPEEVSEKLKAGALVMNAETNGLTSPREVVSAAVADYGTLVGILYDSGYFSPVVHIMINGQEAATIPPLNPPSRINSLKVTVKSGRPFVFGTAAIAPVAEGTELPDGFAAGQPATTGILQDTARAAVEGWRNVGHAKAGIGGQNITANHPKATLNAEIRVAPGRKLSFGALTPSGKTDVRPDAIVRIAGLPTGKTYDPEEVRKAASRLRRTGAFTSVSLKEAETANPDDSLDFDAIVVDRAKRRISFGAEIATTEGLDLSFTWLHRNLFGGAERLQFDARVGNIGGSEPIDGLLSLQLDRPAAFGADYDQYYLARIERLNEPNYSATRGQIGVGLRRTFSDELFAEFGVGYGYSKADDVFGEDRVFQQILFPGRVEWDKRDDKVSATKGWYIDARARPFLGLSGTKSGAQIQLDGRAYRSLGSDGRFVLAGRLQLGSVIGPELSEIDPTMLFYSGGAGTVRGQDYQSLGVDVNGGVAGGSAFLGLSAEVRARVGEKLSLVGFYDYGAVDSGSFVDGGSPSHSGAGLGVRYEVGGFGALRLDVAVPVQGGDGSGVEIYLGIGQAF